MSVGFQTAFPTLCRLKGGVFRRIGRAPQVLSKSVCTGVHSGLNLNQYGVASPCRTICTVCGFVALS
ncbi:hypothetical protein HND90_03080 [Neisseria meningitidis]|uniref:Uncharacterized protein n=3 Tax=Neisseria meningitidis TaxID=487 RepID=C6SLG1_NEIME|nr:hypothetical protein [Neisseria meningitidis]MBG9203221.1 hypothetical protein [Neisseria meningitidis]MBW4020046.1 hypothetical protein [Neisseria meningitidis]MCE9736545.1 hypothetical protein [Neisseria meningitidis]CBA09042.1 hypothetical protein NMW_1786 [Neisseria meningitidis alpha275]